MEGILAVYIAFLVALGNAIPFEYGDHDPDCPFPDSGSAVYYPYPYDCSKFYECAQGKKVLMRCSPGLFWDVTLNNCNDEYRVTCSQVVSSTTTDRSSPPPEPTTQTTSPPPPTTTTGTTPRPEPTTTGTTTTPEPKTTVTSPRPTETSTSQPTSIQPTTNTAASTIDPSGLCEDQPNGTYLPYPGDRKKFIECVYHHTHVFDCPGITFWDQSILNCV
ncbi:unnamed protein product [Phaedon cochleariae]|uniref:Chitin-binding type-2 domain-containing protein n=1 Tax=Phaedon cochleariae TaxID=80249 RepID=A0A9P0DSE7_PHACE|nr:unnamed protein product [Phaedon cochleariae]